MIKRLLALIIFCCFLASAEARSHAKILSKDQLVAILTDILLAKALVADYENTDKKSADALFLKNAQLIYTAHHTDAMSFKKSYLYYLNNPYLMLAIYEQVVSNLEAVLAQAK